VNVNVGPDPDATLPPSRVTCQLNPLVARCSKARHVPNYAATQCNKGGLTLHASLHEAINHLAKPFKCFVLLTIGKDNG